jgi:hypothetical protein
MKYTKEYIREGLTVSDKWLIRGLLAIYAHQTDSEKNGEMTVEDNGIGFNGCDAAILSSIAKQIQRSGTMSTKQTVIVRKKMLKYSGQLARIANGEIKV